MRNVVIIMLFFPLLFLAQEKQYRFRPVFSIGLNASQIDGDTYGGYHKLGYYGGLLVNRQINERIEFELGITFLQKGSRKNANPVENDLSYYLVRLNYAEVPVQLLYNYKKFKFYFGASYAYLIGKPFEESQYGYLNVYPFRNYDVCLLGGFGYHIGENWFGGFRYQYSVAPIRPFNAPGVVPFGPLARYFNRGLYNNCIAFFLNYTLPIKSSNDQAN